MAAECRTCSPFNSSAVPVICGKEQRPQLLNCLGNFAAAGSVGFDMDFRVQLHPSIFPSSLPRPVCHRGRAAREAVTWNIDRCPGPRSRSRATSFFSSVRAMQPWHDVVCRPSPVTGFGRGVCSQVDADDTYTYCVLLCLDYSYSLQRGIPVLTAVYLEAISSVPTMPPKKNGRQIPATKRDKELRAHGAR